MSMRIGHYGGRHVALLLALAAALVTTSPDSLTAGSQGVSISRPGELRRVGEGTSRQGLSTSSFGLGSLQRASGPGGGVLRTSIGRSASYSITRSGGGTGGLQTSPPPLPKSGLLGSRTLSPDVGAITQQGGQGVATALLARGNTAFIASQEYIDAITGAMPGAELTSQSQPLTSLVPSQPGMYTDYLRNGERAFREGNFADAFGQFKMANYLGQSSPESLLSMTHAKFALRQYYSSAYYLRKTLRILPELPVIPLQPKAFYSNGSRYVQHLIQLEEHIARSPSDAGAYLLLAYFRWFDRGDEAARTALSYGLAAAKDPEMVEAIETFWNGMLATGRVSGQLKQAGSDKAVPPDGAPHQDSAAVSE